MSKSTPRAPDYEAAAERQGEASREVTEAQTWANRPNQYTPWGSTTWQNTPTYDPTTGNQYNQWSQYLNLDPRLQAALDSQIGVQGARSDLAYDLTGRMRDEYGSAMSWDDFDRMGGRVNPRALQMGISASGLPQLDPSNRYFQQAEDAIYGKFTNKMDPRFERDTSRMEAQLRAQGLNPGDAAYDAALKDMRESQNEAYEQAAYQATIGGGQEAQRFLGMDQSTRGQMFGERMAQGQFRNAAEQQAYDMAMSSSQYDTLRRQQQITEQLQQRGFTLNEINAILHGQQVGMPSMPNFTPAQRAEGTQYLSAAQMQGQADLDRFNAQQQGIQGLMGGVGSMAQGAMMFSDRRLKKNIVEWTYDAVRGLQTYFWNYIWERDTDPVHYGYMADEVKALYPDAVINFNGYDMVNYARLS